ncbi:MAG: hypothetical protein ACLQUY_16195 [Ktedonobacterales bacterium]
MRNTRYTSHISEPGTALRVASEHAGVNLNRLVPDAQVEPLSGNAILKRYCGEYRALPGPAG